MSTLTESDAALEVAGRQVRLQVDINPKAICGVDRIEASNGDERKTLQGNKTVSKKLRGFASGTERWRYITNNDVCLLSANSIWTVAACFDCTALVLFTSTGVLCSSFRLDSTPSSLILEKSYLSIITSFGFIYVWDLDKGEVVLPKTFCLDVFNQGDILERHLLTSTGVPVLHFASGKTFTFALNCWQMIGDSNSVLSRCSGAVPRPSIIAKSDLFSLLDPVQKEPLCVDDTTRFSTTYSLMEERLNAAHLWQCEAEYLAFLDCYVRWLVRTSNIEKLQDLVSRLREERNWFGNLSTDEVSSVIDRIVQQSSVTEQKQGSGACSSSANVPPNA